MENNTESILNFNRLLKADLIESLRKYRNDYPQEKDAGVVLDFINSTDNLFGRDSRPGHITCSAWVLNAELSEVVLVKHQRLNRWIQPGGHIEPLETPLEGACREGLEETGVQGLISWREDLFHVSAHEFPIGKDGPAHFHYDLRYLFIAPPEAELIKTDETDGVHWVSLDRIREYTEEATIVDMTEKTKNLIEAGTIASGAKFFPAESGT